MSKTLDEYSLSTVPIEQFVGERITIASDELTAVDAARSLTRVVGRDFDAEQVSPDHLPPGVSALFGWLERVGHDVDMDALHQRAPDVGWHTYETWADSQRPRFQELCPREHGGAQCVGEHGRRGQKREQQTQDEAGETGSKHRDLLGK